ncbi:MAG: hypothetical protein JHC31_02580 [Sulfurihydrogenibium sp.]|nr:hypothetical protein [Sulfurihydrogenibium sp.]
MEVVIVKAKKEEKNSWFLIESEFYSDIYNNAGTGFVDETCRYKTERYEGKYEVLTIGSFLVKIRVKEEFVIHLIYEKGKLYLTWMNEEGLIADLCKNFVKEKIDLGYAEIEVEFY